MIFAHLSANPRCPDRLIWHPNFMSSHMLAGLAIAMGPMGPRANVVAIGGLGVQPNPLP